jgi:hypothetical protein
MGTTLEPSAWVCTTHGVRLLWRAASVDCPVCGPLCALPARPTSVTPSAEAGSLTS